MAPLTGTANRLPASFCRMSKNAPRILKGFRDYLPERMIPRSRMLATIEGTFQRFGFPPLATPALEYLETLTGKYGDEGENLLYRFTDHGDREVALRYDLTVPLARVVAQYNVTLPFRRYQIAPVWRAEKPQRGRFREFVQCDADIVGSYDMTADAELVQLACELLSALGVDQFEVRINNRKILSGLMESIGVTAASVEMGILRTIDKLPKIGRDKTAALLESENRLTGEQIDKVFEFLELSGTADEVVARLTALFPSGPGAAGAAELRQVLDMAAAAGSEGNVVIDLSIARGLNYYTGTIYETFLTDLSGFGAVMGGGRYDGLIGLMKSEEIPGVGISLGIDRLLEGLVELKLLQESEAIAAVLVTSFGPETATYTTKVASMLRRAGVTCEVFPSYAKLAKQFKYANRRGQVWVVVAGPEEAGKGEATLKNLTTGQQEPMPLSQLVERLVRETVETA